MDEPGLAEVGTEIPSDPTALYRLVIANTPVVIYIDVYQDESEASGTPILVSQQIENLLGVTPAEWIADPGLWQKRLHPDDRNRIEKLAEDSNERFEAEYRMLHSDGRVVWVREVATVIGDRPDGRIMWHGVLMDITAQKKAEDKARETETRYRAMIEHIPALTYIEVNDEESPLSFREVYVSPQVEGLFGYSPEEWVAGHGVWHERVHPDDRDRVAAVSESTTRSREPYSCEYRMLHKDGHPVWVRDEAHVVDHEEGAPEYWHGVIVDITERKGAELALSESEERFRTLAASTAEAVAIHEGGTIIEVNEAFEQMFGVTASEAAGRSVLEFASPGSRDAVIEHVEAGSTDPYEAFGLGPVGEEFPAEIRSRNVHYRGRDVRITAIKDLTGQRNAEQALLAALELERDTSERLREIDEMKTTFLHAVSHDLRTPLSSILGLAVTMGRDDVGLTAGEIREFADRIARNARKLDALIGDLLDLERLDRGLIEPRRFPTDVGALARDVVRDLDAGAHPLHVSAEPVVIAVDRAKVERIIDNLVSNAIRHTAAETEIWMRVSAHPEGVLIAVEDSGPGVPPELRSRIFEPFGRARTDSASPGLGIGLSLVASFAQMHRGEAWVEDREGGGASFKVLLREEAGQTRFQ